MSDPNAFGYAGGGEEMAPGAPAATLAGHRFSADELRVLSECNRESFVRRSMPFASALGLAAYAAVQQGYLRPNPRFGAVPKVALGVVVGYFAGKLSYQQACAEKLMALPGSYVGQLLRERRDGKPGAGARPTQAPGMFGAGPADIYSDAGPGSSLNLDTDRPVFNDNDTYRADRDTQGGGAAPASGERRDTLTYDELRRRNRGAYSDARQDPYKLDPSGLPPLSRPAAAPPAGRHTNKYGDDVE